MVKPYIAVAVQSEVTICRHRDRISDNLNRCLQIIDFIHTLGSGVAGLGVRLIVFP